MRGPRGVALLMATGSVAILSFLLAELTFETQLNQMRVYGLQDRLQARLNAEAGVRLAISKLRLYQMAFNLISKNAAVAKSFKPSILESLITTPFFYPIPATKGMTLSQEEFVDELNESFVLKGRLQVTMAPVSGFLNPNHMTMAAFAPPEQPDQPDQGPQDDEDGPKEAPPEELVEREITEALAQALEEKIESDPLFEDQYGQLDPKLLAKELKFWVSPPGDFQDSQRGAIESMYAFADLAPKHAPMTDLDELYLLAGWPDEVVDLVKDLFSAHEVSVISVNKITKNQLLVMFPRATEDQVEEFFKIRDGDPENDQMPQEFETQEDFKSVIVDVLGIASEEEFDRRMKEFERANLRVGVAGKLFRVESVGEYEKARYKIVCFIDLPVKPKKKKKKAPGQGPSKREDTPKDSTPEEDARNDDGPKKKAPPPLQLNPPRVIGMRAN